MTIPISHSPPRPPPIKYDAQHGTRWQREKEAAGGKDFENPGDPKVIGPWIIGECVGKGACGRVKIAKHRKTGQLAAVKILPIQPILNSRASLETNQAKSDRKRLEIDREIIMMKLMNHPNIIRIYDVYESDKELFLILEYVECGELFDFLVNHGKLPTLKALAFFKQIVYGLSYAHAFSIIHRDLKPENILIHSLDPPLIKIADWGMAGFAPPSHHLETCCGSPHYASPEIVNGSKYEGNATDIWSCGVILYVLLTGRLPFDGKNVKELLAKVSAGKYAMPQDIDPQAQDLLSRMLVVDASQRLTIPEILSHPWLQNATPGIVYVPAPTVSELAKPLPSAAHIDNDLLESLRILWGRHADLNIIKADLLSSEGDGTLAKALYFLLQRYREKTLEEHGFVVDFDKSSLLAGVGEKDGHKVVTKPYTALPVPTRSNRASIYRPARVAPTPSVIKSPSPMAVGLAPPSPVEIHSRPRSPSPAGPRPPKKRPQSTPVPVPRSSPTTAAHSRRVHGHRMSPIINKERPLFPPSLSPSSPTHYSPSAAEVHRSPGGPRPAYVQRESFTESPQKMSYVHFPAMSPPRQHHQNTSPHFPGERRISRPASTLPPGGYIHVPAPLSPRSSPGTLPMLTAPRTENAEFQRAIDDITGRMNILVARNNAQQDPYPPPHNAGYQFVHGSNQAQPPWTAHRQSMGYQASAPPVPRPEDRSGVRSADKENKAEDGMSNDIADFVQKQDGLFLNKSQKGANKTGFVVADKEMTSETPLKERKERKSRPTTLNFNHTSRSAKRSTVSVPPPAPLASPSALYSPVVGEFKGWFSNLFNWKAQSYVFYSPDDIIATRNETIRLLQYFGVSIGLEDSDGHTVLRCRVEDYIDSVTGSIILKRTCFKVEFVPASGTTGHHQHHIHGYLTSPQPHFHGEPSTPYLSQSGISPASSSGKSSTLNKTLSMKIPGYLCAIVLVQEKGSMSTFRAVYKRLKEEWRLDSGLKSPGLGMGGGATPLMGHTPRMAV